MSSGGDFNFRNLLILAAAILIFILCLRYIYKGPAPDPAPRYQPPRSSYSSSGSASTYRSSSAATPRPTKKPAARSTPKPRSNDPYHAGDYLHPDDFYYDNRDDFWDYEDAEDYWEKHH